MGAAAQMLRQTPLFSRSGEEQTRGDDRACGKRAELAGERDIPDVQHGELQAVGFVIIPADPSYAHCSHIANRLRS